MAKISLRSYNREIETMVDQGQLDEAIAHCRHILNTFPKNLETYRLLGKAYLEAKRYNEATDIFERLLMSVPDDFVAHVGMSIINDEQNNLDAALWHMERAFEVQPSNAAIQSELQRLFGRRDGVEPPKIRLTRGRWRTCTCRVSYIRRQFLRSKRSLKRIASGRTCRFCWRWRTSAPARKMKPPKCVRNCCAVILIASTPTACWWNYFLKRNTAKSPQAATASG